MKYKILLSTLAEVTQTQEVEAYSEKEAISKALLAARSNKSKEAWTYVGLDGFSDIDIEEIVPIN